jgi:hypothetical protein
MPHFGHAVCSDEIGLVPSVALGALPLDCPPQSSDPPSPYDHTAFWVGDHKLAIALEVAREMYITAVALLKKARKMRGESVSRVALLDNTQAIVVVNPEHYTAWNTRWAGWRRASVNGGQGSARKDLRGRQEGTDSGTRLLMTRHRQWVSKGWGFFLIGQHKGLLRSSSTKQV